MIRPLRISLVAVLVLVSWLHCQGTKVINGPQTFRDGTAYVDVLPTYVYASAYVAADCGARINAADAALGSSFGQILVERFCGTVISTPVSISAGHTLRFVQGGTWTVSAASPQITLSGLSPGLVCDSNTTILKMGNSANAQMMVSVPETATRWRVEGCQLDGNKANNGGPYTGGQALVWAGSGSATGQKVSGIIRKTLFVNPQLEAIFVNGVTDVEVTGNIGIGLGGQLVHAGTSPTGTNFTSQLNVHGNVSDFSQRVFVGTVTLTNGTPTMTGAGFNTNWGTAGFDSVVKVAGQPDYTISTCANSTTCTLTGNFTGTTGSYSVGVGTDFGVGFINVSDSQVVDNRLTGPDGALEAINVTVGSGNAISMNVITYPAPHTVGAEGITIANDPTGGSANNNNITGNEVTNPFATCYTVASSFVGSTTLNNNSFVGNTCTNANAGNVAPPSGFNNGLRIVGTNVTGTIVTATSCRSTRMALSPARMSFDYCVVTDSSSKPVNSVIGLTWFAVADTSGTWDIFQDNGTASLLAVNNKANTQVIGGTDGSGTGSGNGAGVKINVNSQASTVLPVASENVNTGAVTTKASGFDALGRDTVNTEKEVGYLKWNPVSNGDWTSSTNCLAARASDAMADWLCANTTSATSVFGVTTVEKGLPVAHWNASATAQAANLSAQAFSPAITSATAGRYRLTCYVAVTQQATTSSTVPTCTLTCTDPADSVAKTVNIAGIIDGVAVNPDTSVALSGSGMCDAKASTGITWGTANYSSVGGTAMQYKVYVILEAM